MSSGRHGDPRRACSIFVAYLPLKTKLPQDHTKLFSERGKGAWEVGKYCPPWVGSVLGGDERGRRVLWIP